VGLIASLSDRLRALAQLCRQQAALAMDEGARDALLAIADAYAKDAERIERDQSTRH
jgi:hypothetical protein